MTLSIAIGDGGRIEVWRPRCGKSRPRQKILTIKSLKITRIIQKAILRNDESYAWQNSIARITGVWNGAQKRSKAKDKWVEWSQTRATTWRSRSMAVVNQIRRGEYRPSDSLYVPGRDRRTDWKWDHAITRMAINKKTEWSVCDEWTKWAVSTASNHRKRIRAKEEGRKAISQTLRNKITY